jgi:hypothetical protein
VSLSPLSAIADMVVPVVLITMAVIFSNALLAANTALSDSLLALSRERLGILGGPQGEMLDEDSVPPVDRERLRQIRVLTPKIIGHIRRSRIAIVICWIAIGLLVLSVAAIAVSVTARSEAFAFTALALVLAGVAGVFTAIAAGVASFARRANSPVEAVMRTGVLG